MTKIEVGQLAESKFSNKTLLHDIIAGNEMRAKKIAIYTLTKGVVPESK